eukprot:2646379-Rhodomonas_salina.1
MRCYDSPQNTSDRHCRDSPQGSRKQEAGLGSFRAGGKLRGKSEPRILNWPWRESGAQQRGDKGDV